MSGTGANDGVGVNCNTQRATPTWSDFITIRRGANGGVGVNGNSQGVTSTDSRKVEKLQSGTTKLEKETFSFIWSIENVSAFIGLDPGVQKRIKSPIFIGGPKARHHWQLEAIIGTDLKKNSNGKKEAEFLGVYLHHLNPIPWRTGIKVDVRVTIFDSEGHKFKKLNGATHVYRAGDQARGWPEVIETKFLRVTSTPLLLANDILKLHCRIWHDDGVEMQSPVSFVARPIDIDYEERIRRRGLELRRTLQELLEESQFADVAISTTKKSIMAHKVILSARSSVFRAMLSAPMVEPANNTIEILDCDGDAVEAMLEFIYTGETKKLREHAGDLLQLGEKYNLGGLKEECERSLGSSLTIENASEVLVVADLYNAYFLKNEVIDFINNNSEAVKKTSGFKVLLKSKPSLIGDLYLAKN